MTSRLRCFVSQVITYEGSIEYTGIAITSLSKNSRRVFVIGWDAADWKVINPLLDAGKMPNLEKLVNEGVMGNLATVHPVLSPMLWTSIATGKRAYKHGIHGFSELDPVSGGIRPVTTLSRKTKAVWNILNQNGYQSNIIGWWPSHPAEPINGVMVSNHYQRVIGSLKHPAPLQPGTVHPKRLEGRLSPLRIHPAEIDSEIIQHFVPEFGRIDQDKDRRLSSLAAIIADCTSIHASATATMQLEPWDFMAVYYDAIDHFCHAFMRYHPPKHPRISDDDFEIYKDVVESGYRYHDLMLGTLVSLLDDETTIILLSDHGFHPDHLRPSSIPREPAGPAIEHRQHGIFVMKGPGIKRDENIFGASLLDICPTILTLFDLPVGQDMDGKSLVTAFATSPTIDAIPSWDNISGDDGCHPPGTTDPIEAQHAIRRLVDLGYIEEPGADQIEAAKRTIREQEYNLAQAYMDGGYFEEAAVKFQRLYEEWPDEHRFGYKLFQARRQLGETEDLQSLVETLIQRRLDEAKTATKQLEVWRKEYSGTDPNTLGDKDQFALRRLQAKAYPNLRAFAMLRGMLYFEQRKYGEALRHYGQAHTPMDPNPDAYIQIGETYLQMKHWDAAEKNFLEAHALDPENSQAHAGLARVYIGTRKNRKAANAAMLSIGLRFFNPFSHFLLGVALHRIGRIEQAVDALTLAVTQNPNFGDAHKRLAFIYNRRLNNPGAAETHLTAAKKIRRDKKRAGKIGDRKSLTQGVPYRSKESGAEKTETPDQVRALIAAAGATDADKAITIVSGLPRTGTSLMMQMLQAGGIEVLTDRKRAADADNINGYYEYEPVKTLRHNKDWLMDAQGSAVKVISQLIPQLPPGYTYRVIIMVRPLTEVIASQEKMLRRLGRPERQPDSKRLQSVYTQQVRQVHYYLAMQGIPFVNISYHDCLDKTSEVIEILDHFLGGNLNREAMSGIADRRLYHQRKETYTEASQNVDNSNIDDEL